MLNKSLQDLYLYQNNNINKLEELKELTNNLNEAVKEKEQQIKNIVKHTLTDTPEEENIINISYGTEEGKIDIDSTIPINCYKFGKYLTILSKQKGATIPDAYFLLFYDTEQKKISNIMLPFLYINSKEYYYDSFTFYVTEKTNIKTIYFIFYVKNSIIAPPLLYSIDYDNCTLTAVETGNKITDGFGDNVGNVIIFDESIKDGMTKFAIGITNAYLYPYINDADKKKYGYYIFNMTMINNSLYYLDTNGYKIKKINITNSKFVNVSSVSFSHDTLFGDNLIFKLTYQNKSKLNLSTDAKTLIKSNFNIDDSYIFEGELSGTSPSTCNINGKLLKYLIVDNNMYFYNDALKVINEIDITGFDSNDNKTSYLSGGTGINIISSPSLRWYKGVILMISSTSYLTVYKCPQTEQIIMCNNYIYPNGYMFYIIRDDTNSQLKVFKMYPSYGLNLQKTTKIYC